MKTRIIIPIAMIYLMIIMPVSFAITITDLNVNAKNSYANFKWNTDVTSNSEVKWGTTPSFEQVPMVSGSFVLNHSLTVSGLSPDTLYYYKVISNDGSFTHEIPGTFKTPDATLPVRPTGLTLVEATKTTIKISWDTAVDSDFSSFSVYRDGVEAYNGVVTSFTDTELSPGTNYKYEVSTHDVSGNEGQKASLNTRTLTPDFTVPVITNIILAASTDATAAIEWTTDDRSTSVVYYRADTGSKVSSLADLVTSHSVNLGGLTKGKSVYYTVSSCNEDGYCSNSSQLGFIAGSDVSKPAFSGVSIESLPIVGSNYLYNGDAIDIIGRTEGFSLVRAFINGEFRKQAYADENGSFVLDNVGMKLTLAVNDLELEAIDPSGNKGSRIYNIMLDLEDPVLDISIPSKVGKDTIVVNGSASEQATIEVYKIPVIETKLPAPTGLKYAGVSASGISISWNKSESAKSYHVYRNGKFVAKTDQNAFTDSDVVNGNTYAYQVQAIDGACGEGLLSVEVSAKAQGVNNKPISKPSLCEHKIDISKEVNQGAFSLSLSLDDGLQKLIVVARDLAGNEAKKEFIVLMDDEKPAFTGVKPSGSDWFYIDAISDIDVEGKTSPNATVKLWVMNNPDDEFEDTIKADSQGNFMFEEIDFSTFGFEGYTLVSQGTGKPRWVEDLSLQEQNLKTWLDKNRFYYLEATNPVGLSSGPEIFNFEMKKCSEGNFSWSVRFSPQYQSPSFLSVERLEEGTERMAFFFELFYHGPGKDVQVERVDIRPADLDTYQENSKAYNLTKLIAEGIDYTNKVPDALNQKWYVVAKPRPIADLTENWGFDDWKQIVEAINNELKLPIEIHVTYKYKQGDKFVSETQKICKELSYEVDNTKLDFSKLPDWLLDDGVKFLNTSVEVLTDLLDQAKPIIDTVGYVCLGSYLSYTGMRIVRTMRESFQVLMDKKTGIFESFTRSPCYEDIEKEKTGVKGAPGNYISMISNTDLKNCYPQLANMWEWEENLYKAYHWSCDRIFCRSAPSPWTGNKNLPTDKSDTTGKSTSPISSENDIKSYLLDLNYNQDGFSACESDLTARGAQMRKIDDCKIEKDGLKLEIEDKDVQILETQDCYAYDNAYWYIERQTNDLELEMKKFAQIKGRKSELQANTLQAVRTDSDSYLFTARQGSCKDICTNTFRGYAKGEIKPSSQCSKTIVESASGEMYGVTYGKTGDELKKYIDSIKKEDGKKIDPEICCCYTPGTPGSESKTVTPFNNNILGVGGFNFVDGGAEPEGWDYRYSKTGYIYPKEFDESGSTLSEGQFSQILADSKRQYSTKLYFEERDYSVSFGQNHLLEQASLDRMDPKTQHVTAFQTACLTGIYKRLELVRNMMASLRTCIESVKYSGNYGSEVCKELFSKYVCDLASDAVSAFISDCSPYSAKKMMDGEETGILEAASAGTEGFYEGLSGSITDFNDEYDNAAMKELFEGGASGVASKACMAAFGYDWEITMDNMLDAAYDSEFGSNVMALVPNREFMFINPQTKYPVYEYRGSIYIMPGCDIESYSADLVCVTDSERRANKGIDCSKVKCGCLDSTDTRGIGPFAAIPIQGGKLTQSVPEERAFHDVKETSEHVYDHLRVKLDVDTNAHPSCLPEDNPNGIFYFPLIEDTPFDLLGCQASPTTGKVTCTSGIATELGFPDVTITEVTMDPEAYVNSQYNAQVRITKNGKDRVCVYYEVYKGSIDNGDLKVGPLLAQPIDDDFNDAVTINVFNGAAPESILGSVAQSKNIITYNLIKPESKVLNNGISTQHDVLKSTSTGKMLVYLSTKNGNEVSEFKCSDTNIQYKLSSGDYKNFNSDCIVEYGGNQIRLENVVLTAEKASEILLTFDFVASPDSSNQADMTLKVEMRIPKQGSDCGAGAVAIKALKTASFEKQFRLLRNKPESESSTQPKTEQSTNTLEKIYVEELEKTSSGYTLDYGNNGYTLVVTAPNGKATSVLTAKIYFDNQEIGTMNALDSYDFTYELYSKKDKLEINKDTTITVNLMEGAKQINTQSINIKVVQKCGPSDNNLENLKDELENKVGVCKKLGEGDNNKLISDFISKSENKCNSGFECFVE